MLDTDKFITCEKDIMKNINLAINDIEIHSRYIVIEIKLHNFINQLRDHIKEYIDVLALSSQGK